MNPAHKPTLALLLTVLAGCGGGGPFDNPDTVVNAAGSGGQKLSFVYFVRCVNPVLSEPITVVIDNRPTTNTCASSGCHDNTSGTGGALRLLGAAPPVDLTIGAAALRETDMYKNYYSSLGETVVGSPLASRLLNKPLVRDVLHGGGLVFTSPENDGAKILRYWINRPMLQTQDEFSPVASMFTATGACNSD